MLLISVPGDPSNLQKVQGSKTSITVTWTHPSDSIFDQFKLVTTDKDNPGTAIGDVTAVAAEKQITGLQPGRNYIVKV